MITFKLSVELSDKTVTAIYRPPYKQSKEITTVVVTKPDRFHVYADLWVKWQAAGL